MQFEFQKSRLSDMHYPITDIQAYFKINRPIRYQITQREIISTDDRLTDKRTDRRTDRRTERQTERQQKNKKQLKTTTVSNQTVHQPYRCGNLLLATVWCKILESFQSWQQLTFTAEFIVC